jgi:methyl-accepting chemotaxis protein
MKLTLSKKIPLSITLASLVTGAALTYFSVSALTEIMIKTADAKLQYSLEQRTKTLDSLMNQIMADLHTVGDSPWTVEALKEYNAAWNELTGDHTKYLQDAYIHNNPNEPGKKNALEAATDGSSYSRIHAKNHPYLNEFLTERGYYDIFLVNKNGDIVYTVFKELDFATNLKTGQWKESDLAKLFERIMAQKSAEDISFVDFAPYAPSNNVPAGFIGRPIEDGEGNFIGALIFQMPIEKINALFADSGDNTQTGRIMLVGSDKLLRNDVRFAKESTILKMKADTETVNAALEGKKGILHDAKNENGVEIFTAYAPYEFDGNKFALIYEMADSEIKAPVITTRNEQLTIAGIIIAIMTLIGIMFARSITKPISGITAAMRKVADGELTTEVPALGRKDEIGNMASALQVFKENGLAMKQLEEQQALQKRAAEEQKKAALREMAERFERSVKGVVDMVASAATEMEATSKSVSSMAEGNRSKLASLTGQISSTSRNVQMVSNATGELSSAINEISAQVAKATSITSIAVQDARQADHTAQGLTSASQKIGEVLEMINSIAAQINLLALNATIEAARAGEAGKGFAVVASEVKSLAGQTTKATEEIAQYITSIQGATSETVGALSNIGGKINEINTIATTIAAAVEEQGVATKDIASNVQQAASGTEEVSRNAADVSHTSNETGSAATEMMAATSELSKQAEVLRSEVDKFLAGVKAG